MHTAHGDDIVSPWFYVDLETLHKIVAVRVYNRIGGKY